MKSSAYWDKRMKLLEQSRYDGNVRSYHEIETIYNKQIAEMEKEIAAWYQRFANNNEISLADARKLLDTKELQELKWNVEDYIKYGRENALDPKWVKQLENASARYHISRLEALQLQLQQRAESVMAAEQDVVDERVRDVYQENYYHTAFEIQRGIGIGWDLERLDERRIDRVISKPWAVDGKNFSERIWEQRDKLVNVLHQELSQSIIRGEDPERAIKALSERMNVSKSSARRLIMTESAAFASEAQQECYNELDVEQYKIVATLDDVTSPLCQGLDGKVFKMSEYAVGSTAPPFHVNCRTVTVPYFADDNDSKRAARGADGKTYLVPANTTYKEWKGAFVDGEEKPFKVDPDWKPPEPKQPEPKADIDALESKRKPTPEKASVVRERLENLGVVKLNYKEHGKPLTSEQIIDKISGGDMTTGSCSSVAFTYAGNKAGFDVADFRGGRSREVFATNGNIIKISQLDGVTSFNEADTNDYKAVRRLFQNMEDDKEYYLATGKHAAIVRKVYDDSLTFHYEYLELQSRYPQENKFKRLNDAVLKSRFKCQKSYTTIGIKIEMTSTLIDIESLGKNAEFQALLEYINTEEDKQKKGASGNVK